MATGRQSKNGCSLVNVEGVTLEYPNEFPYYAGIVVCRNQIFVIDWDESKIRIHGLHNGMLLYESDRLESEPRALHLINETDIAVILDNGLIKIMSTHNTFVIRWTRDLHVRGGLDSYHGVVSFKGDLVVCGVKENTMCWCIVSNNDGRVVGTIHQIFKVNEYSLSFITAKHNIIYILCDVNSPNTGIYAYNVRNPSKIEYSYKHKDLERPRGIVIDRHGCLFVYNFNVPYPCIHHLTSECQLVSIITQGIPRNLLAIFWDDGYLYLTCIWSNHIPRYRTQYPGTSENLRVQGEIEVYQKGNLKAAIDQTETVSILRNLAELAKSIGIIRTRCGIATGFRVGPNYIMAARHIVYPIMIKVPFLQQQQPQLLEQHQLSDANMYIDFCYEWNSLPSDLNHLFYFEPEIVYESAYLDTAILKLKPDAKGYPPPLTKFADVTHRLSQDKSHGYFIGHSLAAIKKTDKYQIVTLTQSVIDHAKQWSINFVNEDGYDGIEDQNRVLFHCSFEHGASGSPGFWINPDNGQAYVELMLLCGYPKWYYDKYQGNTSVIPKDFFVEQGVSMKSVYDDLKAKDELLCNAIFNP